MSLKTDVEKRLAEFRKVRKIGEGTYGEVYEAIDILLIFKLGFLNFNFL
jgi:serine/threonine protein kinase